MQKVNGFSLLEALIGILLSSILVVFTFSIYKNFNTYYFTYTKQTERLNSILEFKRILNKDVLNATTISGDKEELFFINTKEKIAYRFLDTTVIRKSINEKAFDLKSNEVDLKFSENTDKIVKATITVENNKQPFTFSIHKEYGIKDQVVNWQLNK